MNLLKKKIFSLFTAVAVLAYLAVPSALCAWDDIDITTATYNLTNETDYSKQTIIPQDTVFNNDVIANGRNVFYQGDITTSLTGTLLFDKNTLDIFSYDDWEQSIKAPVTTVLFGLYNQATVYNNTVVPGTFSLTISNNVLKAAEDNPLYPKYNDENTITRNGIKGNLYGALVQVSNSDIGTLAMTNNTVNSILDTNKDIFGALAELNTLSNAMTTNLTGTSINANKVNIYNGTLTGSTITGGSIKMNLGGYNSTVTIPANLSNNVVTVTRATFNNAFINGAEMDVYSADFSQVVNLSGNVTGNQLVIKGGEYNDTLLTGGKIFLEGNKNNASALSSAVTGNTITISNGDFYNSRIIGGMTTSPDINTTTPGTISNNTVEISGTANFDDNTWLAGAFTTNPTPTLTNNKLVIKKSGLNVLGVDAFQVYDLDVTQAVNGTSYLYALNGNGRDNALFDQFGLGQANGPWDIDGAKITWSSYGRPTNLALGGSTTLLKSGNGFTGTLDTANSDALKNFTAGKFTYTYELRQHDNSFDLMHTKLVATNWTTADGDIFFGSGVYTGDDVSLNVTTTLAANNIAVVSKELTQAALTAATLDVTGNDTNLTLTAGNYLNTNKPKLGQVNATFGTINIDNGYNLSKSGTALYTFNTMNVLSNTVLSSLDASGTGTHTVNLSANAAIDTINLANAATLSFSGTGTYDFNRLNVYGTGTFNQNLAAANKSLNFFLNENAAANSTALTVNGNANITNSIISVGILGRTPTLQKDDQVVLINATSLTGTPARSTGVGNVGLLIKYQFDVETTANQLLATVTNTQLSENAKAFSEGRAVAAALASQGADFAAQDGMEAAQQAAEMTPEGLATFSAIGGGRSRYETGSHVDLTAFNAAVGLTHEVEYWYNADWILSSFIEYGIANYDTYNSFSSGDVKGKGNSRYIGLGILGKRVSLKNNYFEVSARIGQMKTDFKGAVYNLSDADYDYAVPYYGAHAGLGYVWQLSDSASLDMSGKYFWSRQDGKMVTIPSTGDEINFKATNSSRLRAGARFDLQWSEFWTPYVGIAYDYEFDGKARATTYGMDIDAPGLKGATTIAEAGLVYNGDAITLGIGGQGFAGQRRGVSGHIRLGFAF